MRPTSRRPTVLTLPRHAALSTRREMLYAERAVALCRSLQGADRPRVVGLEQPAAGEQFAARHVERAAEPHPAAASRAQASSASGTRSTMPTASSAAACTGRVVDPLGDLARAAEPPRGELGAPAEARVSASAA